MTAKIEAARAYLMTKHPRFAAALYSLVPVERRGLGTLAVDKWWRLYFDPATIERWGVEELASALWHEVMHAIAAQD